MKKGKYIQNLTSALTSTGLGLFLVIGLTGCDSSNKCKNTSAQNPKNKEIAVNKFCRDSDLEKMQVFRCKSGQKVSKGFVLGIEESVLDMRWVR